MDRKDDTSAATRANVLEDGRQYSQSPPLQLDIPESDAGRSHSSHIRLEAPERPKLFQRNTTRGESTKSVSEALRLARSREEQETLLGADEEADDDGCYPPRINDAPRAPNPHRTLPVYTTIHKIRRLVIASVGRLEYELERMSRRLIHVYHR